MREFDRLFVDFFGTPVEYAREPRTWPLALDIADLGNAYQVKAALPGLKPEEVEVTVADGVLDIKAQRKQETESKDGGYLRRELTYGDYERRVQLPGDVRGADIRAGFENGMLSIEIPKVPAPQPVKIPVVGKPEKQLVGANSCEELSQAWGGPRAAAFPQLTLLRRREGLGAYTHNCMNAASLCLHRTAHRRWRRVLSPIRAQVSSRSRPEARRHALSGAACRAHAARADARFPGSCRAGGRPRPARAGVRRSTRT